MIHPEPIVVRGLPLYILHDKGYAMILANAVVDILEEPSENGRVLGKYRVECWGEKPHDYSRIYTILAKDEGKAAQEGLDTFVQEITDMISLETFQ